MKLDQVLEDSIVTITPQPEGGNEDNLLKLRNVVGQLVEGGSTRILLDMSYVDYINSSEIGCLVGCMRQLHSRKGIFMLCGIGLRLAEILMMVKMFSVLPIRLTKEEAALVLRKTKIDDGMMTRLVSGNPDINLVRQWWDSVLEHRARSVSDSQTIKLSGILSRRTEQSTPANTPEPEPPPAKVVAAPAPVPEPEFSPEFSKEYRDWVSGLDVLRGAKRVCAQYNIPFDPDMSFRKFISDLAIRVVDEKND